ncbi:MAG: T9SS type A sorting domain-containing protein, partial [Bacteroidia bacterium]
DAGTGNVSYQWSNGETTQTIIANVTANYSVVVTDGNNCSNSDSIGITINALPAKPTITQNVSLLTSSSSTDNQWLMNGNIIAGATNNTYTVTLTGWYSVQVTDSNGCTNVSDSIFMDLTGVHDISNSFEMIRLIPNPTTSEFQISGLEFHINDVVIVTDALGKIVYEIKIAEPTSNLKLQTTNYLNGIYFVNVKTGKLAFTLKLMKM